MNKPPQKPKKIWVNKLRGIPTKKGKKYIEDHQKWINKQLSIVHKQLKDKHG